jgi:iron complex transport system permease protein
LDEIVFSNSTRQDQKILDGLRMSRRRLAWVLAILCSITLASVFLAALTGRVNIQPSVAARVLASQIIPSLGYDIDTTQRSVVVDIRLSRICLSALVGMSLSVAGVVFQGILRNPLADPYTIGVSTGAAFGASLAIFLGIAGKTFLGFGIVPLAALVGALVTLFAVITLARVDGQMNPGTMILAGIVVATFLSALISLLKSLDEESVSSIVFWVMGSFQGRGWSHVRFSVPYMAGGLAIVSIYSRELDMLSLGSRQAGQLGVDVGKGRMGLLVGASLLTAGAVSVSGVIGFVGLVVPHLVRLLIGAEHRPLLIFSAILGSVSLIWSDVVARVILPGGEELPVGVVTALLGGPFFCLLLKMRKESVSVD